MKKILSLALSLILCLSLCSCKHTSIPEATKEELLEQATKVTFDQIAQDTTSNIVKAEDLYCGKALEITGKIAAIKDDHIEFDWNRGRPIIEIYLPTNTLLTLETWQQVTIVGLTNSEIETKTTNMNGYELETLHYVIPNGHLVKDRVEITGEFHISSYGYNRYGYSLHVPYIDPQLGNTGTTEILTVYFADNTDFTRFQDGDTITISGKLINNEYHDAVIVE